MKRISKILSVGLSALTLMSFSSAIASAACIDSVGQSKVICLTNADCGNAQSILNQLNCNSCNIEELLKCGNSCPVSSCGTGVCIETPAEQPLPSSQPSASVSEPADVQSAEFNTAYENEVISLVNAERAKYNLPALSRDDGAVSVAHVRAKEITASFSHTRPDGRSCFTAADELGVTYRAAGENIAYGYSTPEQVVTGWMNSEGHRKNILSSSFTKIGVGCYSSGGVLYWSQFFIG